MVTAFGESTGRSVPEIVQYYDTAAAAFDQYLKFLGFSLMNYPPAVYERGFPSGKWSGVHFVTQDETYYKSTYFGSAEIYVIIRHPTENASGLGVYVCWGAGGSRGYIDSIKAGANALRIQLTEWWEHYKKENPRPVGRAKTRA
jgi:hypothetical protein